MDNLTRRQFLKLLGAAAASLAALLAGLVPRAAATVRRVVRARPAPAYPGRTVPLETSRARQPLSLIHI